MRATVPFEENHMSEGTIPITIEGSVKLPAGPDHTQLAECSVNLTVEVPITLIAALGDAEAFKNLTVNVEQIKRVHDGES